MPTTGIVDGTIIRLTFNGEKVVHAQSSSLSVSTELTEISSKDTGGGKWAEQTPGKLSFSGSCEGLYSQDDLIGTEARADFETLFDAQVAQTQVAVKWTTGITGDTEYSGLAYITSLEMSAPNAESATYSFQITGTGALTAAVIPA